jgi:hypothetical protein
LSEAYEEVTVPANSDDLTDLPDTRQLKSELPDHLKPVLFEAPAKPVRVLKAETSVVPEVQVFRLLPGAMKLEDFTVISKSA